MAPQAAYDTIIVIGCRHERHSRTFQLDSFNSQVTTVLLGNRLTWIATIRNLKSPSLWASERKTPPIRKLKITGSEIDRIWSNNSWREKIWICFRIFKSPVFLSAQCIYILKPLGKLFGKFRFFLHKNSLHWRNELKVLTLLKDLFKESLQGSLRGSLRDSIIMQGKVRRKTCFVKSNRVGVAISVIYFVRDFLSSTSSETFHQKLPIRDSPAKANKSTIVPADTNRESWAAIKESDFSKEQQRKQTRSISVEVDYSYGLYAHRFKRQL